MVYSKLDWCILKHITCIVLAFAFTCLVGCSSSPTATIGLQPGKVPVVTGQSVLVEMDSGSLDVTSGEVGQLTISGSTSKADPVSYTVGSTGNQVHIVSEYKSHSFLQAAVAPIQMEIHVPNGIPVMVKTGDSVVKVHDYNGSVNVTSIAGEILAQNVNGMFVFNSNRGNMTVKNGSGEIHLLGNYGFQNLIDTHGNVNASTIMGTVQFAGRIAAGDQFHIETDHGSVEIQLSPDSNTGINIHTTSGVVSCIAADLMPAWAACSGSFNQAEGQLDIRTVSGSVMIQQMP